MFVDAFDRAALGLTGWDQALSALAESADAEVAQIFGIDCHGSLVVSASSGLSSREIIDFLMNGHANPRIGPRIRAALQGPPLRTIAENDPDACPTFRPDLPHGAFIKLLDDGQCTIVLALLRPRRAGQFTDELCRRIDRIAPRLRDAVAAGLSRERQQIDLVCNTLGYLTTAVLALNAVGQIVASSPLAVSMLNDGRHLTARRGALLAHATDRQRTLIDAVAATCRSMPSAARRGVRLIIPAIDDSPMLIAAVAPLPLDIGGWLHTACCLVFLNNQAIARVDIARYLAHRHLLTPSECEIALHLIDGSNARRIAALRTVSEGTVRNQIKAVLAKTGYRRQIDLVAALRH